MTNVTAAPARPRTVQEGLLAGYTLTVLPPVYPAQDRREMVGRRSRNILKMHRMSAEDTDA